MAAARIRPRNGASLRAARLACSQAIGPLRLQLLLGRNSHISSRAEFFLEFSGQLQKIAVYWVWSFLDNNYRKLRCIGWYETTWCPRGETQRFGISGDCAGIEARRAEARRARAEANRPL